MSFVEAGRLIVEDADSTGGTFVRGMPIKRETVDIDDLITIGNARLKVQNDNPLDSRTHATAVGTDSPGNRQRCEWMSLRDRKSIASSFRLWCQRPIECGLQSPRLG